MEIILSNAQIWTIIGIMAAAFASMIGLVLSVVSAKFDALGAKIDGLSDRIGNLETRVHGVEVVLMKPPIEK